MKLLYQLLRFATAMVVLGLLATDQAAAQGLLAFPGAEGAGKYATGGRGGRVIAVTNLNDAGAGSLRAAVEASGARVVVFRVAGTIWLKSLLKVVNPSLTIAGQTAPGQGITVAGHEFRIEASQVIVRYLRFRTGDRLRADLDAVSVRMGKHIILDHLSASWGIDETLSVTPDASEVTVQWCIISESLHDSVHSYGEPHGKGSLLNGRNGARLSFHHNLYAHHADRAPAIQGMDTVSKDPLGVKLDFRNNVIYDWGSVAEGWEAAGSGRNREAASFVNFVNNAYIPGPGTSPGILPIPQSPFYALRYWAFEELSTHARGYWAGNLFNGQPWKNASGQADPRWMVSGPSVVYFLTSPVPFTGVELPTNAADSSEAQVLDHAGASLRRDAVDLRVISQVRNGTGDLIDSQIDVGGWPVLQTGTAPADRDGDGLPDGWERAYGLNPAVRSEKSRRTDGRTHLEHYHEELLQTDPVDLLITTSGPGSASAAKSRLALGAVSALTVTPDVGYVLDRVEMNGAPITLASLSQTPELWADTALHFVFARPVVPLPSQFAKPAALLLARDATLNADLGGMLHFAVSATGAVSGTLWNGQKSHTFIGKVIARDQEIPRMTVKLPVTNAAPQQLVVDFHAPNDLRGSLTDGAATATLNGWTCPWHSTLQPLPKPQRAVHSTSVTSATDTASLRVEATSSGWAYLRVTFADRRQALCNTRLSPDGRWLLWTRPYTGRAPTHGGGLMDGLGQVQAQFQRLQPMPVDYLKP